jgi:CDGSH-type Zn-finger protein/uncharacterized Fe-S cluster protein YjdI
MSDKIRTYTSDDIDVTYDAARCIHVAECVRHLPGVFDTRKRPWVQPANAPADEVAAVVERCPSGALHYVRHTGSQEEIPAENTVQPQVNGPLHVRGDLEVVRADGSTMARDTRLALCRCGASHNKPFCDNSHRTIRFRAPAGLAEPGGELTVIAAQEGSLRITLRPNGSLRVEGPHTIIDRDGEVVFQSERASYCRCGGSASKPFCDGTHKHNGFTDS